MFEILIKIPVNGHVVLCMIGNIDLNSVSLINIYSRPWISSIYSHYWLCMAQSADISHLYLQSHQGRTDYRTPTGYKSNEE